MSDNSNDPFDPEDFERQLEALFAEAEDEPDGSEPDEPSDEPSDEPEPEADPSEPEPETPPADAGSPEGHRLLDRDFSESDAKALIEFYDWVRANPQEAVAIDTYLRGQAKFVPVGQDAPAEGAPAEVPEEDLEDLPPAVREKISEIDTLQKRLDALDQDRQRTYQQEVAAAVSRGSEAVKTRYDLSDEELLELQSIGERLNILPGLAQQRGDMIAAVEETLEIAYWQTPKFRDLAVAKYADQQKADSKRQAKASSLSSGSGSVPRGTKAPSTPQERRDAMVNAIAASMNDTQE